MALKQATAILHSIGSLELDLMSISEGNGMEPTSEGITNHYLYVLLKIISGQKSIARWYVIYNGELRERVYKMVY